MLKILQIVTNILSGVVLTAGTQEAVNTAANSVDWRILAGTLVTSILLAIFPRVKVTKMQPILDK